MSRRYWLPLALLVAGVLGTAGVIRLSRPLPAERPSERHYRTGVELARAGSEQQAVSAWNLAIAMDPADVRPYDALVAYWESVERPDLAAQTLERLAKANPAAAHRDCRFARAAFAAGWVTRAGEAADRAVREEPTCPIAHTMRGILLEDAGETAAALAALTQAHRLAPDDARIALTLAQLEGRSGRRAAALNRTRAVLQREPASPQAHYLMGWLQARAEPRTAVSEREAVHHFRHALDENPEHAGARAELGAILLRQGQVARARPLLEAALKQNPTDPVLTRNLGLLYTRLRDPRGAALTAAAGRLETQQRRRAGLRRQHRREPANVAVTLALARLERDAGQTREAHDLVRELLAVDPSHRGALALLHEILGTPEAPP